ncbi:tenascin-R-like [Saccostrea echinata]|uniref:tenascin-R-like n=1 Tax=Saccostrea echinata TaxID=191078 RepID=UPI002A7ECD92|nr:tenascin-R-like [Saccostrea echinata]
MNFLIFFHTFAFLCVPHLEATIVHGNFVYQGNVSYFDKSLLISELTPTITEVSLRYGAVECYKNLDCNAVEICSSVTGKIFRLSSSISTAMVTGNNTCFRYELMHTCGWGSFYNRRKDECQCVIGCDCGALTPPVGGILTQKVALDGQQFSTNCMNTASHIWTMIQRRVNGSVNFYRGWTDYKNGFGDLNSEFWIGLDNIRLLVTNGFTVLRVELEYGAESVYAEYSSFNIAGEGDKYRIQVFGYSGTAGDGISCVHQLCSNGAQFSTFDDDNDGDPTDNNAELWRGAWWYRAGHMSNLNGEYGNNNHGQGISWYPYKGWTVSLSKSRMMLRRA